MASKVLVPTVAFSNLQVKSPFSEAGTGTGSSGFIIGTADRVAHLEHSVRFLQEQHRLMLSGLHAEIEALRERNRDLQFQLIFNKESSPKFTSPASEDGADNAEEARLRREASRSEREAGEARGEARAAEARALCLQRMLDAHAMKIRDLESSKCASCRSGCVAGESGAESETRAELRARLAEAERLVRRLRADAERQRREVQPAPAAAGVTNLLFDDAAARRAHVACMKNSLQAQLRAGALELGFHNNYQFPPLPAHDYWRDHRPQEGGGRGSRRPLTLPDLAHAPASTVYANDHTRQRGHHEGKNRKAQSNAENISPRSPENAYGSHIEQLEPTTEIVTGDDNKKRPDFKIVITKLLPRLDAHNSTCAPRARTRRPRPRPDH